MFYFKMHKSCSHLNAFLFYLRKLRSCSFIKSTAEEEVVFLAKVFLALTHSLSSQISGASLQGQSASSMQSDL